MKNFLQDVYSVFWREMKHFIDQKMRIIVSIVQPFIWLSLMGNLMSGFTNNPFGLMALGGVRYLDFMTPGIIIMTTLFGGIFGGVSIVMDRRFGYLNKMLASPISRSAIPLGKMLSSALTAGIQGLMIIIVAKLMGVNFVTGIPGITLILFLAMCFSLAMAGISLALAARLKNMETLFAIVNFLTMPLMFTSNAMFPTQTMPDWLATIARWNPLSYVVTPLRTLVTSGWNWTEITQGLIYIFLLVILTLYIATTQFKKSIA
ncbi:MAG: ABC transporter permease [bacterium]